jgi:hypothetical protein
MKLIARKHLIVIGVYLAAVTILRWELPNSISAFFNLVGLWMGGIIGMALLDLDRLIHIYFERPQEQLSQQIKQHIRQRQWEDAIETLLLRRNEQYHLAFRNAIFAIAFLPVMFFAFTSTAGLFGKGLAAGVMLHFLYDAWRDYRKDPEYLKSWLFWMVARTIPMREMKIFLWGLTGVFGLLNWYLL